MKPENVLLIIVLNPAKNISGSGLTVKNISLN